MATREEIREGLADYIFRLRMQLESEKSREEQADDILKYLHSQGVVIATGRVLDENEMMEIGVEVEPLIEEE